MWNVYKGCTTEEEQAMATTAGDTRKLFVQKLTLSWVDCTIRKASNVHCQVDKLIYAEMNEFLVLGTESLESPTCILQSN